MGFVEESRLSLPDYIVPDLQIIETRLAVVEARLGIHPLTVEDRKERNHKGMMGMLHLMEARTYIMLAERLARVETKLQSVA
jgi:hypothetical protein